MSTEEISFEKMKFGLLRKLSNVLGISFEELIYTQPDLSPVLSKAGAVMSYTLSFRNPPSAKIQKKFEKISPGGKLHLDYYVLNDMLPTGPAGRSRSRKPFYSQKITLGIVL